MAIDPLGIPDLPISDPLGVPELPAMGNETIPGYGINPMQGAMAGLAGLTTGGTIAQRPTSLFAQGVLKSTPIVAPLSGVINPDVDALAPGRNLGEQLITGAGAVTGSLAPIIAGGSLIAKIPGLNPASGALSMLGNEAATGAAYGLTTGGPMEAAKNAVMFPLAGAAGRVGGAIGKGLVPMSKEVGMTLAQAPKVAEGAVGLTKMLGLVPAEMVSTAAAKVGAGLASGATGYVFSGGEISDAMIQGVLGGMHAQGNKTARMATKAGGQIVNDMVNTGPKRLGVEVVPKEGVKQIAFDPQSNETIAKNESLTEAKYLDLKQGQKEAAGQYRWEKMAGRHNVASNAKEIQPIRDLVFMAEEARLRGDVDYANDLYAGAEKGLANLMKPLPVPQATEGGQTPIKSSAELAMEKLNPVEPKLQRPVEVPPKLPESGIKARQRREGEAKLEEFINTPDSVLRKLAQEQALVEALQRQNNAGPRASNIMAEAKQVIASGQEQANRDGAIDPVVKAELDAILLPTMRDAEPVGNATRVLTDPGRLLNDFDKPHGGGIGKGSGPWNALWSRVRNDVIKIQETESKVFTRLEEALKSAGFKTNQFAKSLTGGHLFDKAMREQYTGYRLSLFTNEKLANMGYDATQIANLRKAINALPRATIDTFIKSDGVLQKVFDEYFSKMETHMAKTGKELRYEENFFPFYIDNLNKVLPQDYGAVSPYQIAKEKGWRHNRRKYEIPENLIDPITAATRYIRESEMKLGLDGHIQALSYARDVALNGIKIPKVDPTTKQPMLDKAGRQMFDTISSRHDIALVFNQIVDSMSSSGYLDAVGSLLASKPGIMLSRAVTKMLGQVVLTPSTVINSLLSTAGPTGSEIGASRFWRHTAKSLSNPMFLGAAKDSATLKSRLFINDNHIVNSKNFIEHFFSAANVTTDRILIKAAYNAAHEYASETLFKHMPPEVRAQKAFEYADSFADRSMGIFNKIFKPNLLNQKWINIVAPFQTSAFASTQMLWHDVAMNKQLTPQVKAQRIGTIIGTAILARLTLSMFKGEPDNPTSSIQKAVLDQLPIIGDFNRLGGGVSGFTRLLQKPSWDTAASSSTQLLAPRGSYAVYRLYNGIKAILNDGIIRDSRGEAMYQFDTTNPAEILRALVFSPYQTWGVSQQFGERHPSWTTKVLKMLKGFE